MTSASWEVSWQVNESQKTVLFEPMLDHYGASLKG